MPIDERGISSAAMKLDAADYVEERDAVQSLHTEYELVLRENERHLEQAKERLAEIGQLKSQLAAVLAAAYINFVGANRKTSGELRKAADRLDDGFMVGGGNTSECVARILRAVADLKAAAGD